MGSPAYATPPLPPPPPAPPPPHDNKQYTWAKKKSRSSGGNGRSSNRLIEKNRSNRTSISEESALNQNIRSLCNDAQLAKALDVLHHMDAHGALPSDAAYASLLKACRKTNSLAHTRHVQAHICSTRPELLAGPLGDSVVVALVNCGTLTDAQELFLSLPRRTVFSWTVMIKAYVDNGHSSDALTMFKRMQEEGVQPDRFTFVSLFKACGSISDLELVRKLHADARKMGVASDVYVGSSMVTVFSKCGSITESENVFNGLFQRNVVSWAAMLSAYVEHGQGEKALRLFRQMQEEGVRPNERTFTIILQVCSSLKEEEATPSERQKTVVMHLEIGQALHADARREGFASDVFVGSPLITMYGKYGTIAESESVFWGVSQHNIVSCNVMLSAYVEQGKAEKALQMFTWMLKEGFAPVQQTFVIVLQACHSLAEKEETVVVEGKAIKLMSLEIGRALHADAKKQGLIFDAYLSTVLLNIYSTSGRIEEAENVFVELLERDSISWNAMLSAYVEHSQGEKALSLYKEMQHKRVFVDDTTLLCCLQACSETANLEICHQLHFSMVSAGTECSPLLATTLMDAYANSSCMSDARAVFDRLLEPDVVSWSTCIAGYAQQGNGLAGLQLFEKMQQTDVKPNGVTFLSVLLACSHAGLVDKGVEYLESMSKDYGLEVELKHYGIVFDLLARAGDFKRIDTVLQEMPMQADLTIWLCLLGACRTYGNVELGRKAFAHAVQLQPKESASYVLMANIYANAGLHKCAEEVENLRIREVTKVEPG